MPVARDEGAAQNPFPVFETFLLFEADRMLVDGRYCRASIHE